MENENPETPDPKAFAHFLRIANAGRHSGSSPNEKGARELARCILKNCPGLDGAALEGMSAFARFAVIYPTTAREMVR